MLGNTGFRKIYNHPSIPTLLLDYQWFIYEKLGLFIKIDLSLLRGFLKGIIPLYSYFFFDLGYPPNTSSYYLIASVQMLFWNQYLCLHGKPSFPQTVVCEPQESLLYIFSVP